MTLELEITTPGSRPLIGLQSNNMISRFPCVVPDEHRDSSCWGVVEKTDVPLTPVVISHDDWTVLGDCCWHCLPHLAPELAMLISVVNSIDDWQLRFDIMDATADRLPAHYRENRIYATSIDLRLMTQVVMATPTLTPIARLRDDVWATGDDVWAPGIA